MSLPQRSSFEETQNPRVNGYPEPIFLTPEHKFIGNTGITVWLECRREYNNTLTKVAHIQNGFFNQHPPIYLTVAAVRPISYCNNQVEYFTLNSMGYNYQCGHPMLQNDEFKFFIVAVNEMHNASLSSTVIWETNPETRTYYLRNLPIS